MMEVRRQKAWPTTSSSVTKKKPTFLQAFHFPTVHLSAQRVKLTGNAIFGRGLADKSIHPTRVACMHHRPSQLQ